MEKTEKKVTEVEGVVKSSGNAGRIYLPKSWIGKRVKVVLLSSLAIILLSSFSMTSMIRVNADPNGKNGACVIGIDSPCNGPEFKNPDLLHHFPAETTATKQHHHHSNDKGIDQTKLANLITDYINMTKLKLIAQCENGISPDFHFSEAGLKNMLNQTVEFLIRGCGPLKTQ